MTARCDAHRPAAWLTPTLLVSLTCLMGAFSAPASAQEDKDTSKFLKDTKPVEGLLKLHKGQDKLFLELQAGDYKHEYLILISIARGVGLTPLLGGYSWSFGDDWVWQFRKVGERVFVVRKNVRFKAKPGTPEATAVSKSYNDSVLFALPILGKGPGGGDLIDLDPVFFSDLPQISQVLSGGFQFNRSRSTVGEVKGFDNNVELEIEATYGSSGMIDIDSVPDTRGLTLTVHYSISRLPTSDYKPRLADPRVGYFLTVRKDFSNVGPEEPFIRYINRWDLRKAEPSLEVSPPEKPIVFWIERTVPFKYRRAVSDGILEWNQAFEKAGFSNAIEVRQQPDNADWHPEDVNYNTFRWITSSAGFAQGPSRVNPYTGQILDADIIFDADFLISWKRQFEIFSAEEVARQTGGEWLAMGIHENSHSSLPLSGPGLTESRIARLGATGLVDHRDFYAEKSRQFLIGRTALMVGRGTELDRTKAEEKLLYQGLKEVVMHEVGHTLGLRHNFKASTWKSLADINKGDDEILVASVMDYNPTNIMPSGHPQGQYYQTKLGPYDEWAIEYGYKPYSDAGAEKKGLAALAARSGEPGLAFSTDEDTTGASPDPTSNRFDFGSDPLDYAKTRVELMDELVPKLREKLVKEGDDYSQARSAFNTLLSQYGQSVYFASRYVGGVEINRSHKGDKDAPRPIETVDAAKQKEILDYLTTTFFAEDAFPVGPELYPYLVPSSWNHWGLTSRPTPDFRPVDALGMWQTRIVGQLLAPRTLERMTNAEARATADQDVLSAAELIEVLTREVFSEVESLAKPPEAKAESPKPAEAAADEKPAANADESGEAEPSDDEGEADEPEADAKDDDAKADDAKTPEAKADDADKADAEKTDAAKPKAPEGYSIKNPAIGPLRRNLQRYTLGEMGKLALGKTSAPADCQAVALVELTELKDRIGSLMETSPKLDSYSTAHLREMASRIEKILEAQTTLGGL